MLMNSSENAATLMYGPNGFRMIRPGHFVLCAASGVPIPLDELRYWSVELQEPYASAALSTKRALEEL